MITYEVTMRFTVDVDALDEMDDAIREYMSSVPYLPNYEIEEV